jgi:transposase-like protein
VSPRAPTDVDPKLAARLRKLGKQRRDTHEALKHGVLDALDQGASVRVVAELAGVSTATVQTWNRARRSR